MLSDIGAVDDWTSRAGSPEGKWQENKRKLKQYYDDNGDFNVPRQYLPGRQQLTRANQPIRWPEDSAAEFAEWVNRQKTTWRNGKIQPRHLAELEDIGAIEGWSGAAAATREKAAAKAAAEAAEKAARAARAAPSATVEAAAIANTLHEQAEAWCAEWCATRGRKNGAQAELARQINENKRLVSLWKQRGPDLGKGSKIRIEQKLRKFFDEPVHVQVDLDDEGSSEGVEVVHDEVHEVEVEAYEVEVEGYEVDLDDEGSSAEVVHGMIIDEVEEGSLDKEVDLEGEGSTASSGSGTPMEVQATLVEEEDEDEEAEEEDKDEDEEEDEDDEEEDEDDDEDEEEEEDESESDNYESDSTDMGSNGSKRAFVHEDLIGVKRTKTFA